MSPDTAESPFSTVWPEVWGALSGRLDRIAAGDPVLELVRDSALRPLHLLEAMAADAHAALGDDFFAAERLRALLYVAAPWRQLPAEAAQLMATGPAPQPYQPGILHQGKLVIVGLAAVRVAPIDMLDEFLATVHGLALSLSVLEVFGRLEPGAPSGAALETLLRTLVSLGDFGGLPSTKVLRPFALDRVERGRWTILAELFGSEALGSFVRERLEAEKTGESLWDAAFADGIFAVEPASAAPGDHVKLRGRFVVPSPKRIKDTQDWQVVFVDPESGLHPAVVDRRSKTEISVVVPDGVHSGWVGFSDPIRLATSNRYRKSVREFWARQTLSHIPARTPGLLGWLRDAPVPADQIPDLGRAGAAPKQVLSLPPRTASNRFIVRPALRRDVPGSGSAIGSAAATTPVVSATTPAETRAVLDVPAATRAAASASDENAATVHIIAFDVSQGGKPPPFAAGADVDVSVRFDPGQLDIEASLSLHDGGPVLAPALGMSKEFRFVVPGGRVLASGLSLSLELRSEKQLEATRFATFDVRETALEIAGLRITQDGNPSPFEAGQALDVLIAYSPASGPVDAELTLGDAHADGTGTGGTAVLRVPADAVEAGSTDLLVRISQPGKRFARAEQNIVVLEPLRIDTIELKQGPSSDDFVAGVPVDVRVGVVPASRECNLSLRIDAGDETLVASGANEFSLQIPASRIKPGTLRLTFELRAPADPPSRLRDRQERGPFRVVLPTVFDLVLFRPAVVRADASVRVDDAARDALLTTLGIRLGLELLLHELPWIDDALAVIASDVNGPDDPRIPVLLEHLSRAAALTSGLETALWVWLLPPPTAPATPPDGLAVARTSLPPARSNGTGLLVHAPAEAALVVAVCDPAGLAALLGAAATLAGAPPPALTGFTALALGPGTSSLAAVSIASLAAYSPNASPLALEPPRPRMPRLRLLGKLEPDGSVSLEPAREEERLAGPGADVETLLEALALDAAGRPLQRQPIKAIRGGDDAHFVLLMPVSPEVESVQILRRNRVVAQLGRTPGSPALRDVQFDADAEQLSWSYDHTRVASATLEVQLLTEAATFAFAIGPCTESFRIPTQRLPSQREVSARVAATDGWNQALSVGLPLPLVEHTLILRHITGGQWFADTNLPGPFAWRLDGRVLTGAGDAAVPIDGPVVRIDKTARGVLEVECLDAQTHHVLVSDQRELGASPSA